MGKLLIIIIVGVAAYFAWHHFNPATPEGALPEPRLAPPGVYYVVTKFSVEQEDGLYSFPVLKKVQLVRDENGQFIVTDGKVEASAPASSFTNDLDEVDRIRARLPRPTPAPSVAPTPSDTDIRLEVLNKEIEHLNFKNDEHTLAIQKLKSITNPGTRNIPAEINEKQTLIDKNNLIIAEKRLKIKELEIKSRQ